MQAIITKHDSNNSLIRIKDLIMKKIIITASLTLFTGLAIAGAKSGFVLSGEGSYSSISGTSSISESGGGDDWSISTKRGPSFGLGAYLGYDYALTEHLAVGIKTGYFNSFGLGKIDYSGQIGGTDITSSQTFKSSNIPVLFGVPTRNRPPSSQTRPGNELSYDVGMLVASTSMCPALILN